MFMRSSWLLNFNRPTVETFYNEIIPSFWYTKKTCRQIKQCPNRSLQVWGTHILELGLLLFHSEVWFNRINQIIGPASPTSQVCFHLDNALCFLILHNNPEDLKTADLGLLQSTFLARMDEISRIFGTIGRERSDSYSTQSTGSKLLLRHRLNQLMTCVDDLDPKTELHEKMIKTLDNAFLVCGKRANKPKKDSFRWRTDATLYRNDIPYLLFCFSLQPASLLFFSLVGSITCLNTGHQKRLLILAS